MPVKALGLLSGGLDSILAVRVLLDQGIEITGLSFATPFFGPARALEAGQILGIPVEVMDITEEHMVLVKDPPHGHGKNMNPCIDCHGLMVRKAGELCEKTGRDFIFTGEVLGERPFSQNRHSLDLVARLSGYPDILLRPLSAQLLPETRPEREGQVDRSRLLDIEGRCRKRQMDLARYYNISDYPAPAGGCLLTDPPFSRRLAELLKYTQDPETRDLELLKVGRHFRLPNGDKIIVGRHERDNARMRELLKPEDTLIFPDTIPGPDVLVPGGGQEDALIQACQLCNRYSDLHAAGPIDLIVRDRASEKHEMCTPDPEFHPETWMVR
jgi:tRNA U34 2-thiouridine synthase MnmA/TrmU